ncbi:MAG TPA: GntG family PLP-dependent aldolase, partial [Thermoleophilia bacterium]
LAHQGDGTLALADIEAAIKPDDAHFARSRLLCLENTLGGRALPLAYMRDATALACRRGLAAHLDGARLFNAATALHVSAREIAQHFDSVSVCFSKGLGAPVGSVLVMNAATLPAAARARKVLGGGMRQAGVIAAGGLYALEHNVARLADDHGRARRLAEALAALPGLDVDLDTVQTNMVFAGTRGTGVPAAELVSRLAVEGVLCLDEAPWSVRFVTHLDVDDDGLDAAIAGVKKVLGA